MQNKSQNKNKGKAAELIVAAKLLQLGYNVLFPLSEGSVFDLVINKNNKYLKIQIKGSFHLHTNFTTYENGKGKYKASRYVCALTKGATVHSGRACYSKKEIDFIIAYIEPLDQFYILPIRIAAKIKTLQIGKKIGKYEKYKNNWKLLQR